MNALTTRFHSLRVTALRRETPSSISLTLAVPEELQESFRFTPGQYLTLRTVLEGEEVRRSYSLCCAPSEGVLRIGIKAVEGGRFSHWANTSLAVGDSIEVMPPEGRFGLRPDPARVRAILAIAAGSGITPVLSILGALLEQEPGSRAVLLYGNRSSGDIMFREALDDLKDRHLGRLSVVHVLSRERQELEALHGRLDGARIAALLPALLRPEEIDTAFLCGPDGMTEEAATALAAYGVPAARIQRERFTPAAGTTPRRAAPAVEATPAALAEITVGGITRAVPVARGETILEAGLRAGLDLPWSCRGGMCCTCRCKVTEGSAAMEVNYSLEPDEVAAGFVLSCQARPEGEKIIVDYDCL
ncbi:phenylacetate-CoA oxygenase/reductase subunit PaaK [Roseomonas sp. GC11]|uniref:1,2-phenylacetyl-CoA epoxidase subunit PaaE n=1 Tax=Roseomonas sp. GC11 TaxID=2950546 RepID=UPI00210C7868|nr:1,2-phenylacetyl-CoA epoxidase subunit PaaE [Roseomonas sp. GC11]MCQ4160015.1 phenylacetate-CoA oxygenase/reductase subunit PaaK [Roseomonas sp. GC11]